MAKSKYRCFVEPFLVIDVAHHSTVDANNARQLIFSTFVPPLGPFDDVSNEQVHHFIFCIVIAHQIAPILFMSVATTPASTPRSGAHSVRMSRMKMDRWPP